MQTTSIPPMKRLTSTVECYDAWSNTYDTDGNVLQLLDDIAFEEIAQPLLDSFSRKDTIPICCELGCGTGRNTRKIIDSKWSVVSRNKTEKIFLRMIRTCFVVIVEENI